MDKNFVINKRTRVTKKSITCIDHIYINYFYSQDMSAGIIKTDTSDHFSIFIIDNDNPRKLTKEIRIINDWDFVTLCQSVELLMNLSCYLQFTLSRKFRLIHKMSAQSLDD